MTLTVADRRFTPGYCRELGCDLAVSTLQDKFPVIVHIYQQKVDTYVPSPKQLDDLAEDIWADVRIWADGLHG